MNDWERPSSKYLVPFLIYVLNVKSNLDNFDYDARRSRFNAMFIVPFELTVAMYINDACQAELVGVNNLTTQCRPAVDLIRISDFELPNGICSFILLEQ